MLRSLDYEVNRVEIPEFRSRFKANAPKGWKQGDPIPKPLQRQYRSIKEKMLMAEALNLFIKNEGRR
jgi:hypothetical protein